MELFPYQKEAVQFIKDSKKVYLAMDMGTGKTVTALTGAVAVSNENILVIAELNEVENSQNFKKEVETHFPDWVFINLRVTPIDDVPKEKAICIANIDLLKKLKLS